MTRQARALVGVADAVNVTDSPRASTHMSPVAGSAFVASAGLELIVQLACRHRNRLALAAHLLGAWALGARNVLCLTGDRVAGGDHSEATEVAALTVEGLVTLATRMREAGTLPNGDEVPSPPRYFVCVAPLRSARQARFLDERVPGVTVPPALTAALEQAGEHARDVGVARCVDMVRRLTEVPGIGGVHVMGMGHEEDVRGVTEGAGLLPRPAEVAP